MLRFIRQNLQWLSAGFLLCLFSGFGQTYFISLSNETLRTALSLSHGGFGAAYAAATLASAVALTASGGLTDLWTVRRAALVTVSGLACACLMMAFAHQSLFVLLPAIFGLRLFGQGFCGHVAFTAAGKWFFSNRGKAVSLIGLGFPVSEAILPVLGVALLSAFGFGVMWSVSAAFLALVSIPVLFLLLRTDRQSHVSETLARDSAEADICQWRRSDVVRRVEFYLLNLAVLCPPFMVTAFFFHQQHLTEIMGWSMTAMVGSMSVFAFGQIGAKLLTGVIIDRRNARSLLQWYLLPLATGFLLPYLIGAAWIIPLVMGLTGISAGISATLLGVLWPELFGSRYLGEVRAVTYAAMVASTAVSPVLTGVLIDRGVGFDLQLLFFSGFCLLASATMFLIQPLLSTLNGQLKRKVE